VSRERRPASSTSDCSKKESSGRHAALTKETQLAVKPGPNAVSNVREGKPA